MAGIPISVVWLAILAVLLESKLQLWVLLPFGLPEGALIAFLIALAGGPLWLQITLFLAVSVVLLLFTRPLALKYMNKGVEKTNVDSMPGKSGIVTQSIDNLKAQGKVTVNGMEWTARSKDGSQIEEGRVVRVYGVEGVKLIVEEEK